MGSAQTSRNWGWATKNFSAQFRTTTTTAQQQTYHPQQTKQENRRTLLRFAYFYFWLQKFLSYFTITLASGGKEKEKGMGGDNSLSHSSVLAPHESSPQTVLIFQGLAPCTWHVLCNQWANTIIEFLGGNIIIISWRDNQRSTYLYFLLFSEKWL